MHYRSRIHSWIVAIVPDSGCLGPYHHLMYMGCLPTSPFREIGQFLFRKGMTQYHYWVREELAHHLHMKG